MIAERQGERIELDWTARLSASRSEHYKLNTFQPLLPLLDPVLRGNVDAVEAGRRLHRALLIVLNFGARYPYDPDDPEGKSCDNAFAWYDMAIGVRASFLAYIAARLDDIYPAPTPAQRTALCAMIDDHSRALIQPDQWAEHSNHGYYQSAGLFALSVMAPHVLTDPNSLRALAIDRVTDYLNRAIGPDGLHREHSASYHNFILRSLSALIPHLDGVRDREAVIIKRFRDMMDAQAALVLPNGLSAPLGDTDMSLLRGKLPFLTKDTHNWPDRLIDLRWPKRSRRIDFLYAGLASGLAARKFKWKGRSHYLALWGSFHGQVHKHADDLSVIWSEGGVPILSDAGRFGYPEKNNPDGEMRRQGFYYDAAERIFVESTHAHTAVEVDGSLFNRRTAPRYGSCVTAARKLDVDRTIMLGGFDRADGVRQDRFVMRAPVPGLQAASVLIVDRLQSLDARPHTVTAWHNLFPCWRVEGTTEDHGEGTGVNLGEMIRVARFDPDWAETLLAHTATDRQRKAAAKIAAAVPVADYRLHVACASSGRARLTHHRGQTAPRLMGWASLVAEQLSPTCALALHSEVVPGRSCWLATLICCNPDDDEHDRPLSLSIAEDIKGDAAISIQSPIGPYSLTLAFEQEGVSIGAAGFGPVVGAGSKTGTDAAPFFIAGETNDALRAANEAVRRSFDPGSIVPGGRLRRAAAALKRRLG